MASLRTVVILVICTCISGTFSAVHKIQTARTALHVARSLDPDSMESVSVKTRTGDLTTIIVKKRNGKSNNATDFDSTSNHTESDYILSSSSESNRAPDNRTSFSDTTFTSLPRKNRSDRIDTRVPDPVYISSSMVFVKNDQASSDKKAKSLMKVDSDGIPIVTGVRVPDDDSDKQVWRNGRVINGILVPYDDKINKDTVTKQKPLRKATTVKPTEGEFSESWSHTTRKPIKLMPSAELVKHSWAEQNWDILENSVTEQPPTAEPSPVFQAIERVENMDRSEPVLGQQYVQQPAGLWIVSKPEEMSQYKYVTDQILEYIRNINRQELRRQSIPKFTARNARMLPTATEEVDDPPQDQQPQIQPRILHVAGASSFPTSAAYSSSVQTSSRVSFEGVRSPVLQYAHPEYGVQSAMSGQSSSLPTDSKRNFGHYREEIQDMHADRGPFVFELDSLTQEPETMAETNKPSLPYYQRPKKTFSYFYPDTQTHAAPNKYYAQYSPKDDYKYPTTLYHEDKDGRPFWVKLGNSLKEHVQSSIDKVSDLTRPVVEPLVEATQKISHNLGLSPGNGEVSTLREKLGTVSTSSLILPAIGIMAGGAALGLGAVAVGRYLNYDVVKMRDAKSMKHMENPLIPDSNDAAKLEALWAKDNSRSEARKEVSSSTANPTSTPSSTFPTVASSSEPRSAAPTKITTDKAQRLRSVTSGDLKNT